MYSDWAYAARNAIAAIDKQLAADISLKDRRKALRDGAWDFHGGTSWGRRVWGRECRKYLEAHGQPRRTIAKQPQLMFTSDISFPFRTTNG